MTVRELIQELTRFSPTEEVHVETSAAIVDVSGVAPSSIGFGVTIAIEDEDDE